jgi:ubiquinone/menaquinone biosynthesis C-methylase UbiE
MQQSESSPQLVHELLDVHSGSGLSDALGGVVIDAGCGSGSFVDYASKLPVMACSPRHLIQLDLAAQIPTEKHVSSLRANLDGQGLPLADECAHTVVCMHVLEHVHHPCELLCEFHRILKNEGWLLVAVPNGRSLSDILYRAWKRLFWLLKREPVPHVQNFSLRSLQDLIQRAGFASESHAVMGEDWVWLSKHPRLRRMMLRLTKGRRSAFLTYGWWLAARKVDAQKS